MINWLASYPKSGNTWARMLLTAYHNGGAVPSINDTPTTGDAVEAHYQATTVRQLSSLTPMERVLLRNAAMLNMMALGRHKPLIVKTHNANVEMYGQRMISPLLTSGAVYVVRDPRKVAPSYARHFGKTLDETIDSMSEDETVIGGGKVEQYLTSWSKHVQSWGCGDPDAVLIRYEDMQKDPGDALGRMLAAYGLELDPVVIDRSVKAADIENLRAQEAEKGFAEASKKAGGNFFSTEKELLSDAQRLRVENDHAEVMETMGY